MLVGCMSRSSLVIHGVCLLFGSLGSMLDKIHGGALELLGVVRP